MGYSLFGSLHQDGFFVVSSIEFKLRLNDSIEFVLFKVCWFIVDKASLILLSSMLQTFYKTVTDKICCCVYAKSLTCIANMAAVSLF